MAERRRAAESRREAQAALASLGALKRRFAPEINALLEGLRRSFDADTRKRAAALQRIEQARSDRVTAARTQRGALTVASARGAHLEEPRTADAAQVAEAADGPGDGARGGDAAHSGVGAACSDSAASDESGAEAEEPAPAVQRRVPPGAPARAVLRSCRVACSPLDCFSITLRALFAGAPRPPDAGPFQRASSHGATRLSRPAAAVRRHDRGSFCAAPGRDVGTAQQPRR